MIALLFKPLSPLKARGQLLLGRFRHASIVGEGRLSPWMSFRCGSDRQVPFDQYLVTLTSVGSRANVSASERLGVQRILATSTVGSFWKERKSGDVVFIDQFIDATTKRE
jgi:hypothetical protein